MISNSTRFQAFGVTLSGGRAKRALVGVILLSMVGLTVAGQHGTSAAKKSAKGSASSPAKSASDAAKSANKTTTSVRSTKSRAAIRPGERVTRSVRHKQNDSPPVVSTSSHPASPIETAARDRRVTMPPAVANAETANLNTAGATKAVNRTTGKCDPEKDQRVDLSGTYPGKVDYPAAGFVGDATLTIMGNRFTLDSGTKTEIGNVTAVSTCNYTAVAMMFGEWKTPQPGDPVLPPLPMLSLRAVKKGTDLTLTPAASEKRAFSFTSVLKK